MDNEQLLKSVESMFDTLANGMNEMKSNINEMKGDINEMKGDIKDLKDDVSELKTDMKDVKNRLDSVETNIDDMRNRIDYMETDVKDTKSNVLNMDGKLFIIGNDTRKTKLIIENEVRPQIRFLYEAQQETHANTRDIPKKVEKIEEDIDILSFVHGDVLKVVNK